MAQIRGPERGKSVSRDTLDPISGPQIRKTHANSAISGDGAEEAQES